jgi:hypothetical protein
MVAPVPMRGCACVPCFVLATACLEQCSYLVVSAVCRACVRGVGCAHVQAGACCVCVCVCCGVSRVREAVEVSCVRSCLVAPSAVCVCAHYDWCALSILVLVCQLCLERGSAQK